MGWIASIQEQQYRAEIWSRLKEFLDPKYRYPLVGKGATVFGTISID
jgi:hypothetical protein